MTERQSKKTEPAPEPLPAEEAAALRQERDGYLDLLQRTRAEFENYQKRAARERDSESRYRLLPLAVDLLPVIDNLQRALDAAKEETSLSQGVALVKTQLLQLLQKHGITPIDATGQPFDPHTHEAVMQQPSADHPAGTVLQTLEPGYRYHDRVLRPSKVIVSKATDE
jgi:molecular chaperone GrpE